MLRALGKMLAVVILALSGALAIHYYTSHNATEQRLREAEAKNAQLQQIVARLSDERRVAELLVTDQSRSADGITHTNLLLVETARDGSTLAPKSFTVQGDQVHIDALVIKFDRHFVSEADPLRGKSIALFTRVYGDLQSPASAEFIDRPGTVPEIYRGADEKLTAFETSLWRDFWRLYEDESFRQSKGVRVASGHGVWGPLKPDQLYTITLESDGGLNLIASPLKPIYREALKRQQTIGSAR